MATDFEMPRLRQMWRRSDKAMSPHRRRIFPQCQFPGSDPKVCSTD